MIACGALWDQREFRQTRIHGYSRMLTVARPFVNLAGRIIGTPPLPRPGSVLAHAILSPLAFADGADAVLPELIETALPMAAKIGAEFLTIALPAGDSRLTALQRRFSTRTWRSRLYRVDWPERAPVELSASGAAFLPDVSLL